ncbi:MAG: TetR family transcriptional regulator [Thermoanaerobaculum sp.]|nr:TetR family transcriptional regulator [Thermoanaerobaculum sp.]
MASPTLGQQRKRTRILEAAVRVFGERGYFGARMRDVAQAAGVADGTLYLYFASKEDLLTAILEEYAQAFVERARRDCQDLADPRMQLRRVLERHLLSLEQNRALAAVFQIELRHSRRFLRRIAKGQVAQYLLLLQELVARGIQEGIFRPTLDPRVAARAIFGAVDELVTAWVLAHRPASLAAQLEPLLEVLLYGLCTEQPAHAHGRRGEP